MSEDSKLVHPQEPAEGAEEGDEGRSAQPDEHDPRVNPVGSRGIGEIGICGSPATIANPVHHATGIRVLPITLEKLLY